jgi:glycine cleavage system H protein
MAMTTGPNDALEWTVDKFTFRFPTDLRYTDAGLWIRQEGSLVRMGLSDFAQQRNGDIAFADLAPAGTALDVGDEVASIETVKVNISLPSPVKGTVMEINPALQQMPELINREPYGRGWLTIVQSGNPDPDTGMLLDVEAYLELARQQAEAELSS